MRRILLGSAALLLLFLSFYLGGLFLFSVSPGPGDRQPVLFEVSRGQSQREIAQLLEEKKIVSSAEDFRFLGRVLGKWSQLKAGEYQLSSQMSPLQVLSVLTSGASFGRPLTVREGENSYEIAKDLETLRPGLGAEFLHLALQSGARMEGYLFPETYAITRTMTAEGVIKAMVRQFEAKWDPAWTVRAAELGMSRHQIVILASIIEKETGAPEERPMISSVFHNRLKKGMRLQSDPTTIYGIWESYDGNIRRADLLRPTPFNTYTVPALPAGPIGNPGKESIRAALYPAESDFLFFVSKNDGTHEFTSTLVEHNAAVREFQLRASAREGKSWRNLQKRGQQ